MTCGHCVASVTEEVGEIAGVEEVDVVLETGGVTVTSRAAARPREPSRRPCDEAGYALRLSDDAMTTDVELDHHAA